MLIATGSCNRDKNDIIPDVFVDFSININDPEFSDLKIPGNSVTVNASTNNLGYRAAGYAGNGIIIYHDIEGEFFAFDRTCPHDFAKNGATVKLDVDYIYAICPVCKTYYAMSSFGTPASGPGRYPLKNYRVAYSYPYIRVWN